MTRLGAENTRLREDAERTANWKRWGPYLSERQWGTVREDYSADGSSWDYFPHDHARSRTYRWGEDGLLGISDREQRLCFAFAFWNGHDPILKERLFGLTGSEGNHGEDVKELYYYLDSTPTHSYMKALYKYPQSTFPYGELVDKNRGRGLAEPEYELLDTGVFDEHRYYDILVEYAKASPNDIAIRLTVSNRGPDPVTLHVLPTVWFRNTWSWGREGDGYWQRKPLLRQGRATTITCSHPTLGAFQLALDGSQLDHDPTLLFAENETNVLRLFESPNETPYVKDAFNEYLVQGRKEAVNPAMTGTKAAFHLPLQLPAFGEAIVRLRLHAAEEVSGQPFGQAFDDVFKHRILEANEFYAGILPEGSSLDERNVARQAYAGLMWSKQFYHFVVKDWLEGDPAYPPPPATRQRGRNRDWQHLYNRDVISMPDKWEYPWYAAWDLAFHMIPFAKVDPEFAKQQLVLMLREWYLHPNGQIPAYEWAFGDVNPPVHAWACWRVYKMTGPRGSRDRHFLSRVFHKLLVNFTWWVNRKDPDDRNLFAGGFLGLDNIGVFDRSRPLPTGGHLEQADGTAWMAFYCATMLSMSLELAREDSSYEDVASKFFEHFIAITDAINSLGGTGLWDEEDGFFYDSLHVGDRQTPLKVRSLVGLLPLIACEVLEEDVIDRLPGFKNRMQWFLDNRPELANRISCAVSQTKGQHAHRLLAVPSRDRLERALRYMLDEEEFLSPFGIRAVSRVHRDHPYVFRVDGAEHRVEYVPGESNTDLFGGNSNWRGPIWFPLNYLIIEALERYDHFYGSSLTVELPTGSGRFVTAGDAAKDLASRLARLFLPSDSGRRPCHGNEDRYATDIHWRDLVLFYEYFHGDNGRGVGASHQTGWTALAVKCIEELAPFRAITSTEQPATTTNGSRVAQTNTSARKRRRSVR